MEIKTVNLNKKIGTVEILKNINLFFESGSTNVIIGPNGAGKTSLLKQLALLDKPSSGDIFFDGQALKKISAKAKTNLRRQIGFIFQNPVMLSGTVFDNVVYGLKVRGTKIDSGKIEKVISTVGLSEKTGRGAGTLSGGEKQRLSLARIIVLEPETYIFDEPTANLDPVSVKIIENVILRFSKAKKTIILATHNLQQARKFGQKIFFMNNGEIIQEGSADNIFSHPISLDIAEYSVTENIIRGKIVKENGQKYLLSNSIKISVVADDKMDDVAAILRPEDIFVSRLPIESSARNSLKGKIERIENLGAIYDLTVNVNGINLETVITKQSLVAMNLKTGDEIYLTFKATSVHLIKNEYDT